MLNIRCFLSCVQIFEHFLNTLRPHFCVALCHLAVGAKIALKRGKKNCKPLFRDLHFLCELFRSRIIKFYVIWLKNVVFRLFAHSFRPRPPFNPIFSFSLKTHSNPDASAAYAVTVQAKKVVVPANTKTSSKSSSSNAGNSSNSGAAAAAPSNPVPAPDPAPVQPSEPAPAPDPQPDPAPAEPQPDNRDYTDGSGANGGKVIEGRADNSCTPEQEAGGVC